MEFTVPQTINKICIYNASGVTKEWGPAALSALRNVYPQPDKIELVSSYIMDSDNILYIIICPAGIVGNRSVFPKYYIIWQLEYLEGKFFNDNYISVIKGALIVWEYSSTNFDKLRDLGVSYRHVLPGYNEMLSRPEILAGNYLYDDSHKDVDVSFLGWVGPIERRQRIQNAMLKAGFKIWFVWGLTPDGMKEVIRRSKVCLNLLSRDPFPLSSIRLSFLLSNVSCVVSEHSTNPDLEYLYESIGVTFSDYDKLVETCRALVDDPLKRKICATRGFQWIRKHRRFEDINDFSSLLPQLPL